MGLPWTPEEFATAVTMRRNLRSLREIGAKLGRSTNEVGNKFKRKRETALGLDKKNAVAAEIMRSNGQVRTPHEVLFSRDQRLNAPDTLLTFFGDPHPQFPRWNSNAAALSFTTKGGLNGQSQQQDGQ